MGKDNLYRFTKRIYQNYVILIYKSKNKTKFTTYGIDLIKDALEVNYVITDNINFHGYVLKDKEDIKSRNLRGLVRKIKNYIEYLKTNSKYKTTFYDKGDGISVTERR